MTSIFANILQSLRTFGVEFNSRVLEGFQVTPLWHQGFIHDDGSLTGRIMQKLLAGSIALASFMDGAMWAQSKSPRLAGWLHSLYLNLIGKYAWQLDFQQVLACSLSN